MPLRTILLLASLMALIGCASQSANTDSADYQAGYSDGCASGSAADGYPRGRKIRDEQAFANNPDYKSGWRAGYNACVVKTGRDPFERGRF